jgi:hypothetical protein
VIITPQAPAADDEKGAAARANDGRPAGPAKKKDDPGIVRFL